MIVGGLLLLIGFLVNALFDKPIQGRPIETAGLFIFMFGVIVEVLSRQTSIGIKIAAIGLGITIFAEILDLIFSSSYQTSEFIFDIGQWMMIVGIAMHIISTMRLLK